MRAALLATFLVAACSPGGGSNNVASHTPSAAGSASAPAQASASAGARPSPSATPSTTPVTSPYGVLVGSQGGASYTVSLVAIDGKVVAADASTPPLAKCGNVAGAPVPLPVSTSNSRAYFMDAQGGIHFLAPDGTTGRVTSVPVPTASRRATFAVSPDDSRIAVVVVDYGSAGASTRLYAEDLNGGGNHVDLFSESGLKTLWAVGWHGTNNLVLAVVPACTQGGGPFCCGPQELHVVDPATATRRFTLGGQFCAVAGAPSPAGVMCEEPANLTTTLVDWTGKSLRTIHIGEVEPALVSPEGDRVALVSPTRGATAVYVGASYYTESGGLSACSWLDDFHVLAGGDAQQQPRIADVRNWTMVPVAATGDCGGRLPGGL